MKRVRLAAWDLEPAFIEVVCPCCRVCNTMLFASECRQGQAAALYVHHLCYCRLPIHLMWPRLSALCRTTV